MGDHGGSNELRVELLSVLARIAVGDDDTVHIQDSDGAERELTRGALRVDLENRIDGLELSRGHVERDGGTNGVQDRSALSRSLVLHEHGV